MSVYGYRRAVDVLFTNVCRHPDDVGSEDNSIRPNPLADMSGVGGCARVHVRACVRV